MYIETHWTESHNFSLLNAISTGTKDTPKYHERGDRTNPTPDWISQAQNATHHWILGTNPDAEDFRSALSTVSQEGSYHGVTFLDVMFLVSHGVTSSEHKLLKQAKEVYLSDISGARHFGDSLVVHPRDNFENSTNMALFMANSNGCPKPMKYLSKIRREGITINSLPYQESTLPELSYFFPWLDDTLKVHIWDNARANKTWLHLMGIVEASGNQNLYHDIMHKREELPDSAGEIQHLPAKVSGKRQVRLLALSEPYAIVKSIWEKFDLVCSSHPHQAETQFDADITRLKSLIQRVPTLSELAKSFLST